MTDPGNGVGHLPLQNANILYNTTRTYSSLDNMTPDEVYYFIYETGWLLVAETYNDGCQWKMTTAVDIVSLCLVSCIDRYRG